MLNLNLNKENMTAEEYNSDIFMILQAAMEIDDKKIIKEATDELVLFNTNMLHKLCHDVVIYNCEYDDVFNNAVCAFISIVQNEAKKPESKFKGAIFTTVLNEVKKTTYEQTSEIAKSYESKKRHVRDAAKAATDEEGVLNQQEFEKLMSQFTLSRDYDEDSMKNLTNSSENDLINPIRLEQINKLISDVFERADLSKDEEKIVYETIYNNRSWTDLGKIMNMSDVGVRKKFYSIMNRLKRATLKIDSHAYELCY